MTAVEAVPSDEARDGAPDARSSRRSPFRLTLSRRLILTVTASVGIAIACVAVAMGLLARDALIEQAETQARLVAGMIAAEANRTELTGDEIDRLVTAEMETQAIAVAHLVETSAHNPALQRDLDIYLAELSAYSTVDDIWLLDEGGTPLARATKGLKQEEISDLASAGIDERLVAPLVSGRRFSVDFRSAPPPTGLERPISYVGVRAGDGRIVLLGSVVSEGRGLARIVSLSSTLESLAGQPGVRGIWVVDDSLDMLGAVFTDGAHPGQDGTDPAFRQHDASLAQRALMEGGAVSRLDPGMLRVAAPTVDRSGVATGAAVLHMPRDRLDRLLEDYIMVGCIIAAAAFLAGSVVAAFSARRIVRPVAALTAAAVEIDADTQAFRPESLDSAARREDELGRLVRVFQTMVQQVQAREEYLERMVQMRTRDLEKSNAELAQAKQRMDAELNIARSLQSAILPKELPEDPSYSGRALMTPAQEMGGDFYDFFVLDDGRLGLVMADVSGKGVPAAFFMAIARTVMQAQALRHSGPGACLAAANDAICEQNPHDLFVTMFYGILDPATGDFVYANAGHNPPLVIRHDGGVTPLPGTGGVAVGVMPDLPYDEDSTTLGEGETIFLFTDGITEAMNAEHEEFSDARLEAVLRNSGELQAGGVLEKVKAAVVRFVGEAPQSDDITCIALRYEGPQENA